MIGDILLLYSSQVLFMNYRSTLFGLLLWVWGSPLILPAQSLEDCQWEPHFWEESIEAQIDEVREGDVFYLAQSYLDQVKRGHFDHLPSGLVQYVYLRPASKQELNRGEVAGHEREAVGPDGNVYVSRPALGRAHFFRAGPAFSGVMDLYWEDPNLVIPLGLEPVDALELAEQPITLVEKAADYLKVEASGETLFFFRGFPRFGLVFQTRQVQARLAARQQRANHLKGRRWLLLPEATLASRSGSAMPGDPSLLLQQGESVFVDSARVAIDRMRLCIQGASPSPRLVYAHAPVHLYSEDCVISREMERLSQALAAESGLNTELATLAQQMSPDSALEPSAALGAGLEARFQLDEQGAFRYVFAPRRWPSYTPYVAAELKENGQLALHSHYAAPQGLYHTRLILYTPEGDSLFTTRVSTLDDRYVRTYLPEGIEEDIRFTEADDLKLIEAIARHSEAPLRLKFTAGGDFFREIELTPLMRAQIRDTYLLYRLMDQDK
ncbi:MAG: hypothetical protein D6722_26155, partial [Bacteroidetes bacterium]